MINDSLQILRLNAEYDALIHASRPLLTPGDPNTDKATKWIQYLSKPVNNMNEASDRVKKARNLLRKLKAGEFVKEPPGSTNTNFANFGLETNASFSSHASQNLNYGQTGMGDFTFSPVKESKSSPLLKDTGYQSTFNTKNEDLASVSSINTDLNHPKFSQLPNSTTNTPNPISLALPNFEIGDTPRANPVSAQVAQNTIPQLTPQNSHQIATSMHEYKLQLQRASDLAMEKNN